ncbi:sialic acid TRAP transporter substrate-binding protein SiaP [Halomonas sp. PAMB 3264]|uniref:sialic acid TRAP transporter substrate-binding protein SiaP n=1 Tax=unclassified Halomonas TaxID=2609666 RepID=UPI00289C97A2|nr:MULTISPECIES: sialic acid TRAP transporter substrate-binding protein SiaP [unclassified Halomonas]WNL38255.1 sialic acid TRAP transporter substrate-binding protein SiaP [Halomonas sp. PAMB 3232]WNL41555.1 sialic acid TRAP transporter substrate-binding protein SiaP [Halomonas sp. PAMB 3264]
MRARHPLTALFLALSLASTAQANDFVFGHIYEASHSHHQWAQWAAEEIEKRSEGRHTVEVFPSSQLGNEVELNEGLDLGVVDIIYTGNAFAGNAYPPIALGSAPFVFRNFDHWLAYARSDLFQELAQGYEETTGHVPLGLIYFGQRHVTANQPILTPEDMQGMKIRVPDAALLLMFPRAVGANPTPIAFSEVYLALQQGVVDGQENPLPIIKAMKFNEVQSDISLTGHIFDSQPIIMSGDAWSQLSEEDQTLFREVFREAGEKGSADIQQQEQELVTWFEENGTNVHEVDREPFAALVRPYLTADDVGWSAEQLERLEAIE